MNARVRLTLPEKIIFTTQIPVRITDINYGGHMGNDSMLTVVHEARMQCLAKWGMTEMNAGGIALIMADAAVQFKAEAFYGDVLEVAVSVGDISDVAFELYYKMSCQRAGQTIDIAWVKTGIVCFDYTTRKKVRMSEQLRSQLLGE
jgi:acyl-CoA thioester hydrolase